MILIDRKFAANKGRYLYQCLLATFCVLMVLLVLKAIADAAVIVSMGASAFIAFTLPNSRASSARKLIGGYTVGVLVGSLFAWLSIWLPVPAAGPLNSLPYIVYGAPAVGLSLFVMTVTETEHPPAASIALGLVLGEWSWTVILVAMTGIVAIHVLKSVLRPGLINLG